MWAARDEEGNLWFGGLSPFCAECLARVPEWLESDDPRVRERLLPETYTDPEEEEQWRKHGCPELERLFRSRSEIVRRDLESLRQVPATDSWFLAIRRGHEAAWLAALNGVRHALFTLDGLEPADMERNPLEIEGEARRTALLRIHFLAEVQMVIMDGD